MTTAKKQYKLSGLIKSGAVRPSDAEPFEIQSSDLEVGEDNALSSQSGGREMKLIPVSLIDANPLAPREVYTPSMIRDRADALRTQGQHDPIHVIPNPENLGRYIICDGWTRVLACRDHQVMGDLLAEVHKDMTLEQSAWFGYQQNEEREQHCDLDRALFFEKLISAGESVTEVAKKAHVSKSHMTSFRAFSKLPTDVIEIIKSDPKKFGANAAYQIHKIYDRVGTKHAARLAVKFATENHTYAWLVNQVQSMTEPRQTKPTTSTKQVRYTNGFYKQKGDSFEVSIVVDSAKRARFAADLEELLSTVANEEQPNLNDDGKTIENREGGA